MNEIMRDISAYVICFREDKARRDLLKKRFNAVGIDPQFIDAVRGTDLNDTEKAGFNGPSRQLRLGQMMKDNAIGCALSHHQAWQAIIENDTGCGFVFEDDAIALGDDTLSTMQELVRLAPRLDVVSLANRRQKLPRHLIRQCGDDRGLYLLRGNDIGAESYFITAGAARRLLAHRLRQDYEVDMLIHHWWHHGLQVLHLLPPVFAEEGRPSSIGYDGQVPWPHDSLRAGLMRRFNRLRDSLVKRRGFSANLRQISTRLDDTRQRVLVIQPMVGIGDMVWHKPWLDAMIARHDIVLMAKPSAQAAAVLGEYEDLEHLPLYRSERGKRGHHDGFIGFFRMAAMMRSARADHIWILHRSWRYAAAAMLAGIRFRSGYGVGNQQKFLNDSVAIGPAMKKAHPRDSVAAFAMKKGVIATDPHPRITPTAAAAEKAIRLGDQKKPLIICGVGAADAARRWSPGHFAGMIDRLAAAHPDYQVALCGSPAEAGIGDAIIAALGGKTPHPLKVFDQPVDVVIALHQRAVLYIGNDTSLINIAVAVGTPAIRIFASTLPVLDSPLIETIWPADPERIDIPGAIDDIDDADVAAMATERLGRMAAS